MDDVNALSGPSGEDKSKQYGGTTDTEASLVEFLPQSNKGFILITSRSRDAAFRLTGNFSDVVTVGSMEEASALALLRNKLGNISEEEEAMRLVKELDYMPLAITQAAAYILQRAPRATVLTYLQELSKDDQHRAKFLDKDIGDVRRDHATSNSIIATWQITFEHIRTERASAARLLSLMSFFDRQGIPDSLLVGRCHQDEEADLDFEEDLNMLISFSVGNDCGRRTPVSDASACTVHHEEIVGAAR